MTFVFVLSCAFSVLSCVCVPRFLVKGGFLDIPTQRSSHSIPTPKGGGVGIVLAFGVAAIVLGLSSSLWLPAIMLASFSFLNDLRNIPPMPRLAAQFLAAATALCGAWWTGEIVWTGYLLIPAIFFVVATANWFNFMDGIDGIAGIAGLVAFACLALFGGLEHSDPLLPSILAILGGLAGFMPFNFPRARLFMGDAGSIFLGFFFACSVCLLARTWSEFFVFASFLFPFYADEAVTTVERLWRRESLLTPHRRHLYQFLVNEFAIAHWKVSVGYGIVQAVFVFLILMAVEYGLWAILTLDFAGLVLWGGAHYWLKFKF